MESTFRFQRHHQYIGTKHQSQGDIKMSSSLHILYRKYPREMVLRHSARSRIRKEIQKGACLPYEEKSWGGRGLLLPTIKMMRWGKVVVFADFHSVNNVNIISVKLSMWGHWTRLGRVGRNPLLWAVVYQHRYSPATIYPVVQLKNQSHHKFSFILLTSIH